MNWKVRRACGDLETRIDMGTEASRRDFIRVGTTTAAGLVAVGAAHVANAQHQNHEAVTKPGQAHEHNGQPALTQPGPGGPFGSPTDRGKLVSGHRSASEPPVPIDAPDLTKLDYKMVDGAKEFHLHAQPVQRELLPGAFMNHWGYNGTMPGPTIEVNEGDRVRIVLHNELPEATTLHLHGLELPNVMDGVEFVTQDPIMPGATGVYELTLHQNGTFFYHPHMAMQEAFGMVGLFIIHPRETYQPVVDHDFALIVQEFDIPPASNTPATAKMPADFNWFTINGRSGPYTTPLVVRLGNRVRIRFVNFSTDDHHPMHLHGHTFWVTGTEGGRIPESAWVPGNNVLVGVAQARDVEFIANNPGDWVVHCHMFHHMMNHMEPGIGPGSRKMVMMETTSMMETSSSQGSHAGHGNMDPQMKMNPQMKMDAKIPLDPYTVPGYPQDSGMMAMMSKAEVDKLTANPLTRGMAPQWHMGVMGLMTVVRVLPPDLYDQVISGQDEIPAGASVPGGHFMPMGHMEH
jgi:FtsP/CotA-like multicopper oxidase with cupredoxin domain